MFICSSKVVGTLTERDGSLSILSSSNKKAHLGTHC
jgi:hypothetical protein